MRTLVRYILVFLFALLSLAGCRMFRKRNSSIPNAHAEKQVAEQLQKLMSTGNDSIVKIDNIQLETGAALRAFYNGREAKPAWVDKTDLTGEMITLLSNSAYYGLDSTDYNVMQIRQIVQQIKATDDKEEKNRLFAKADILLTNAYFMFAYHVQHGRLDSATLERREIVVDAALAQHLEKTLKRTHIEKSIEELEPKQIDYTNLRKGIEHYLATVTLSKDTFAIPDPKEDSISCYNKVKYVLAVQQYLDTTKMDDSSLVHSLRQFQVMHGLEPDGRAGAHTREALSKSTYENYRQMVVNLERWRWQSDWGRQYIFVNIPAYHLKVIDNSKQAMELRVIVGKPSSPTPELSSQIENMITNPFWHVPESIYTKELLPEIKEDPTAYLAKHSYKVFDKDNNPVDPAQVNWSDAKGYRIRQEGGDANSLGRIKFNFNNKFNVYLHDTPSRNLFSKEVRSLSHGCVRVQNPVTLAGYLLNVDHSSYKQEDIESLISKGQNRHIALKQRVPVHIRYFTCEADNNGNVYFYRDVYNKDEALKEKLFD
jgi:murein L,D-transpeptidase YcbB/YkuD